MAAPADPGGTGCAAAQADRCRGGPGAGPQGPHADHREQARPRAGRRRGGRLQRRRHRTGPAARRPRRQRRRAARRPARAARRHRRRWSSPTPWAGPGATARPTPPSARPGCTVLHGYAGAHDAHGNELVVTEVAVADEIAAAADLVKGKLTGDPGRRGARADAAGRRVQRAARCCGRARKTCSGWAPRRRSRWAAAQAQLLRRSVRRFSARAGSDPSIIEAAVAEALTAPAPHHTRPVRFVWMRRHRSAGSGCWTG